MLVDPKLPQGSSLTRSTPAGVTLVHIPLAGTGVGSAATVEDGRLVRAVRASAKVLHISASLTPLQLDRTRAELRFLPVRQTVY